MNSFIITYEKSLIKSLNKYTTVFTIDQNEFEKATFRFVLENRVKQM